MSNQKRNEYLDAPSDSEDADLENGYDSEAHELSRGGRTAKRRKLEHNSDDDGSEESDIFPDEKRRARNPVIERTASASKPNAPDHATTTPTNLTAEEPQDTHATFTGSARTLQPTTNPPTITPRTLKPTTTTPDPHLPPPGSKPGILYLSRIPPFLKPSTLRTLLTPYAPRHGLARLFLTPEDPETRKLRVRTGGNKKKSFTDGWVEFVSKREAKIAAEGLNGRPIGGKGWYREDLWNVRYLRGFRWGNLVESLGAERREREGRLRVEVAMSARENRRFVEAVGRGKIERTREGKRKARGEVDTEGGVEDGVRNGVGKEGTRMAFKQREVRDKETRHKGRSKEAGNSEGGAKRVLGAIF